MEISPCEKKNQNYINKSFQFHGPFPFQHSRTLFPSAKIITLTVFYISSNMTEEKNYTITI